MIALGFSVFLWAVALGLCAAVLQRHGREPFTATLKAGLIDFRNIVPRLAIGFLGSGFMAALIPEELVQRWLGADSGFLGLLIAAFAGMFVPGGPVVGFTLGAAALKGGAALGPITAFVTAWALYGLQRVLVWEVPFMPSRLVWLRVVASLPLPLLAAYGVTALEPLLR